MRNQKLKRLARDMTQAHRDRSPFFDSGMFREPFLAFGGRNQHPSQKTGLGLYGPYTLAGQDRPSLSGINVGAVGPPTMLADAEQWLDACSRRLLNDGHDPFLHPHFPGINAGPPFQCELRFGETWREGILQRDIDAAIQPTNFYERVKQVVSLYVRAIGVLAEREPHPHVVLCCIPQDVISSCTERQTRSGEKRRSKTLGEKRALKKALGGQTFLFPEMNPTLGIEDQEDPHENLRRGIKAEAMQYGMPTQIVWPRTLRLIDTPPKPGEMSTEDCATRAWNFMTALYHKAGGTPWRLADVDSDVCFVGVSFYRELRSPQPTLRTALAQAFTSAGDGYVLRGSSFEWDESQRGRSPHLDAQGAASILRDVLQRYKQQNNGNLPGRVVIHKSSKYFEEELLGFREACSPIPRTDFVALVPRGIQFYRLGIYPPLRGTYVKFSDTDFLLYTVGYVPYLRTYPGPRIPQPLGILVQHADSPWDLVLREILALTKMNWNTAYFACSDPITVAFSRRVGLVLAELPSSIIPRPEYRFYM